MTSIDQYFPVLFCLMTLGICLYAGPLAKRLRVVDYPDGARKGHPTPTPLIGGIAIMVPLALWCLMMLVVEPQEATRLHLTILLCGVGVALMGFMDDQAPVSARSRFLLLIIFAVFAFTLDPSLVTNRLNWTNGSYTEIPAWAFCALIVLGQVGLVSALNMADGMNGLVLSLYLVWFLALALISAGTVQAVSLLVCSMLVVTLLFNARGRLFLGDCGTFAVTFVLGVLVISAHNAGCLTYDAAFIWFCIPIVDCLRLIATRLARGRSPFLGDKNHFHHRLMHRFGARNAFVVYASLVSADVIAVTVWPSQSVVILAATAMVYVALLLPHRAQAVPETAEQPKPRNVVSLRARIERPRNRKPER